MSDTPQGPGWWQASDGKWYAPEQHPDHAASAASPEGTDGSTGAAEAPEEPTAPQPVADEPTAPQAAAAPGEVPSPSEPSPAGPPPSAPPSAGPPPSSAPPAGPPPAGPPPSSPPPASPPPSAPPPAGPPPASPPPASAGGSGGGGKGKIIVGIVAVIALVAAGFVVVTQLSDDEAAADEVSLLPVGDSGPNAFMSSIAPEPSGSLRAFADSGAPSSDAASPDDSETDDTETDTETDEDDSGDDQQVGYRTVDGSTPGLYGGTLDETSCDAEQLAAFLSAEPEKADAFADVLKIDADDIPAYVDGLTPMNLSADTRVLNHGFSDGEATSFETVLQRGTAVLVDRRGVPRVNCYCGNPLLPPEVGDSEAFSGDGWDSFQEDDLLVVDEADTEVDEFDVLDIETGELFTRTAGSGGTSADRPAEGERNVDGPIDLDRTYEDRLEDDRTEALYTFDAPDGAILTVTVSNRDTSNRRVRMNLESEGSRFADFRVNPGAEEQEVVMLNHQGGGEFELRFTEGPAAFEFEVALETQSDADGPGDAGAEFADAFEIESGQEVDALLGGQDDQDRFLLEVQPGSELLMHFEVARSSDRRARVQVSLDGSRLFDERVNPGVSAEMAQLLSTDDSGTIEINVTEGGAEYSFVASFVAQGDGGIEGDAGDSLADARTIAAGEDLPGRVGHRDGEDWYLVEVPAGGVVIPIENSVESQRRVRFEVQDPSGSGVGSVRVNPGASDEIAFDSESGGEYRIRVSEGPSTHGFAVQPGGASTPDGG